MLSSVDTSSSPFPVASSSETTSENKYNCLFLHVAYFVVLCKQGNNAATFNLSDTKLSQTYNCKPVLLQSAQLS
jgi:hypothetical protein